MALDGATEGPSASWQQHVVACVTEHALEVVHHPAPGGGHAARGDDERGAAGAGQGVDGLQVCLVAVHGVEVLEGQRVAAAVQAFTDLEVPVALPVAVGLG